MKLRFIWVCLTTVALHLPAPSVARADKEAAQSHLSRARELLADEHYVQAIEAFEQAFAAYPSPQFVYNIAQIQRTSLNDCAAALVSYRRFLAMAPFDEEALRKAASLARKHERSLASECPSRAPLGDPPDDTASSTTNALPADERTDVEDYPTESSQTAVQLTPSVDDGGAHADERTAGINGSSTFKGYAEPDLAGVLRMDGGGTLYSLGTIDTPVTASVRATLGLPLGIEQLPSRVILSLGASPMRYRGSDEGIAYFLPLMAGLEMASSSRGVAVTGALQVGVIAILGLDAGNPVTADGAAESMILVPAIKARVGLQWPIARSWSVVGGMEAGAASRSDIFADDIESVTSLGVTAGVSRDL